MAAVLLIHPETRRQLDDFVANPTHAVLLEGRVGLGKTLMAAEIAARLLNTPEEKLAVHPYALHIAPEKGVIPIEKVRELRVFFSKIVPGHTKIRRIVVVEDVDTMTIPAQNAFLKLLEEPPTDTVLLLTSSRPQALLPTIRSRVQHITVHEVSGDNSKEYFIAMGYTATAIDKAMHLSEGNIAQLQAIVSGEASADDSSLDLVKTSLAMSSFDRLLLVNSSLKERGAAIAYCDMLATVAHGSLLVSAQKDGSNIERWTEILDAANKATENLHKNANVKLVLSELFLSL